MDNRKTDSIFKVNNVHFLFLYNVDRREQGNEKGGCDCWYKLLCSTSQRRDNGSVLVAIVWFICLPQGRFLT